MELHARGIACGNPRRPDQQYVGSLAAGMIEGASRAASARGTVFWRITEVEFCDGVESLIEIQADGSVLREVDIATDGTPIRITRPGEWGVWNDDPYPPTPTDAEEFQSEWSALGSEIRAKTSMRSTPGPTPCYPKSSR